MAGKIQAIRGMHDILAEDSPRWRHLERTIQSVLGRYGYQEIRLPILEKTELFERSIGAETDIVAKEMYTFADRNGENLTLRPEGTASCVRAGLEHGLFNNTIQRLWYMGPMFRHERPQKGRLRQFHQIGVEVFGLDGPDIDAELIIMCARMWRELGLDELTLEINTLGTIETRRQYRELLVEYFSAHTDKLDEDSLKRLTHNPLRILDSKNPDMQALIAAAPPMEAHLDEESQRHFQGMLDLLDAAGVAYRINRQLVRGLDYYSNTVFEWISDRLGAQGTVCAGGRYNGLVEYFGGKPTPGIGFAMGLERLLELTDESRSAPCRDTPHLYLIIAGADALSPGFTLAERIRDTLPGCRIVTHSGGGSFKSQFKKADKSGAEYALILGEAEAAKRLIGIKPLRREEEQMEVSWDLLPERLRQLLKL